MVTAEEKHRRRSQYRTERAALAHDDEHLRHLNAQLLTHIRQVLDATSPTSIAAYCPLPGEPGGPDLVENLHRTVPTVWLPISLPGGVLNWTAYQGADAMRPGALGISEPAGPREPTRRLLDCPLILIPALACHPSGVRMGQGAGYYDRALAELRRHPNPPKVIALLHPGEIREDVPIEPHDQPVDLILTAEGPVSPR
ncbi:5-formyltetrahydrofolate cyclo-ligase [Corynebacterium uropygiale]|uniref:5-formyltetrahydrofolate cyclo-ligase n=1 Tax=Corynebacterium uropygiale TaxID=1775911 RepID=A0A9X1U0R1_9CORY|nr:5-formyltetrahydrofolate cyclo-ligase [Corynebacterium uropygiale]MCF4006768.1 5-formyltetrahydrofolate cyclo-ligase [Corynebacterium uropygiale]